jgi:hypothetical protein
MHLATVQNILLGADRSPSTVSPIGMPAMLSEGWHPIAGFYFLKLT